MLEMEMATLFGQTQHLGGEFMGFYNHDFAAASNSCVDFDSVFDPDDVLQYLCFPATEPPQILNPTVLADEFESFQCPKRRKINFTDDLHYNPSSTSLVNAKFQFEGPAQFFLPETDNFHVVPTTVNCYNGGGGECLKEEKLNNVSSQSVAARKRRRKISEKTAELGKLIPGGNRMNTAEMFHAAYKYIKFLQAQVGILQLMGSTQGKENKEKEEEENVVQVQQGLELLLASPTIHEKLYSEEKCLVPKEFVTNKLVKHDSIQINPLISKQIHLLTHSTEAKQ